MLARSPQLWARSEDRPAPPARPSSLQRSPGPRELLQPGAPREDGEGARAPGLQGHVGLAALASGGCDLGPRAVVLTCSLHSAAGLLQTPVWQSAEPRGRVSFGCFCSI